jgi:hypothetical protein
MTHDLGLTLLATDGLGTKITLYSCNHDSTPTFADHYSVEEVGKINVTFSTSDISNAQCRWSDKANCLVRQFLFTLTMKLDEGQLVFKAMVAGEERGSARITFT